MPPDYAVFNPHLGEVVVILEGCMQEVLPQVGVRVSSEIRRHFRECCPDIKPVVTVGHAYSTPSSSLDQAMSSLSEARAKASADRELSRSVLIVDDDELFAMSTARVLGMFHFKTTCVSTADEALGVIEREIPDLVILDIMMPGHDGYRLGRALKSRADLKHIPIVFISALERDETLAKVLASGGSEFLQKPIEAADLIKTIKSYLG
jgi:CheY-like chemotaxis protein